MSEPENKHVALAEMVATFARENNLSVMFWCHEKDKTQDPNVAFVIENMDGINTELCCETIIGQHDVFSKLLETFFKGILGENVFSTDYEKIKHIYTKKQ